MNTINHDLEADELAELVGLMNGKTESSWKRIWHDDQCVTKPCIRLEGGQIVEATSNHPASVTVRAVFEAYRRRHARRSTAAKKAAETRRKRRKALVYQIAAKIINGSQIGPRHACAICGKGLSDLQSIKRGIGSDCWQDILQMIHAQQSA